MKRNFPIRPLKGPVRLISVEDFTRPEEVVQELKDLVDELEDDELVDELEYMVDDLEENPTGPSVWGDRVFIRLLRDAMARRRGL